MLWDMDHALPNMEACRLAAAWQARRRVVSKATDWSSPPAPTGPFHTSCRLEAGTSLAATLDGMKAELADMRKIVQLEEGCADPATLDALKRAYRQKVGARAGRAGVHGPAALRPAKERALPCLGVAPGAAGRGMCSSGPSLPNQRPCPRPAAGGMLFAGKPLRQATSDGVMLATPQFEFAGKFNPMEVFTNPAMMEAAMDPEVSTDGTGSAE